MDLTCVCFSLQDMKHTEKDWEFCLIYVYVVYGTLCSLEGYLMNYYPMSQIGYFMKEGDQTGSNSVFRWWWWWWGEMLPYKELTSIMLCFLASPETL
jgi:hypothetical protein